MGVSLGELCTVDRRDVVKSRRTGKQGTAVPGSAILMSLEKISNNLLILLAKSTRGPMSFFG